MPKRYAASGDLFPRTEGASPHDAECCCCCCCCLVVLYVVGAVVGGEKMIRVNEVVSTSPLASCFHVSCLFPQHFAIVPFFTDMAASEERDRRKSCRRRLQRRSAVDVEEVRPVEESVNRGEKSDAATHHLSLFLRAASFQRDTFCEYPSAKKSP